MQFGILGGGDISIYLKKSGKVLRQVEEAISSCCRR